MHLLNFRQKSTGIYTLKSISWRICCFFTRNYSRYKTIWIFKNHRNFFSKRFCNPTSSNFNAPSRYMSLNTEFSIYSYLIDPLLFIGCSIPVLYFGYRGNLTPKKTQRTQISKSDTTCRIITILTSWVLRRRGSLRIQSTSSLEIGYIFPPMKLCLIFSKFSYFYQVRIRLALPMFIAMLLMIWYSRKYLIPKYTGVKFLWIPDLSKTDPYHILAILLILVSVIPVFIFLIRF